MNTKISDSRISIFNDEKEVAYLSFTNKDNVISIEHTIVDSSMQGQGLASSLLEIFVDQYKYKGILVAPICSYATRWFEKHPEYQYLLKIDN